MGEQKSDFGLQGGNTVRKGSLEFVLYYIRFDLQGGNPPTPTTTPPLLLTLPFSWMGNAYLVIEVGFLKDEESTQRVQLPYSRVKRIADMNVSKKLQRRR